MSIYLCHFSQFTVEWKFLVFNWVIVKSTKFLDNAAKMKPCLISICITRKELVEVIGTLVLLDIQLEKQGVSVSLAKLDINH